MSLSKSFAVFIAFIAWFALGLQLYILVSNTPGNGMTTVQAVARFFIFFTILTNLLVAICLTATAIDSSPGNFFSRPSTLAATAVYIFIVGLIYNVVLRKLWAPVGDQKLADELLHVIVPVLYVAYWLLFAPKYSLQWKHAFVWLCYPAIYLVYAMVRGAIEGFYPYPFINLNEQGIAKVLMNIGVLLMVFLAIGFIFIWAAKKITAKKNY